MKELKKEKKFEIGSGLVLLWKLKYEMQGK